MSWVLKPGSMERALKQASHAEAGADQQHQANGDLRDDDAAAQAGTARAGELPLVFQSGQKVAARGAQCGHDAEENPSQKCGCESEAEYTPIQRSFKGDRNAGGFEAEQSGNGPLRDGESAAPPIMESNRLSVSAWRTILKRPRRGRSGRQARGAA